MKVLLSSFNLSGHAFEFHPQTLKLEPLSTFMEIKNQSEVEDRRQLEVNFGAPICICVLCRLS